MLELKMKKFRTKFGLHTSCERNVKNLCSCRYYDDETVFGYFSQQYIAVHQESYILELMWS